MSGLVWFAPASVVYMCLYTNRVWTISGKLCCTDIDGGVKRHDLLTVWLMIVTAPLTNNDYWSIILILHKAWCGFDRTNNIVVWEWEVLWIVTFCPEEPMGWCLAAEEVKGKGCGYRKCLSEVLYPFCPGYTCSFFSSCAVLRSSRSGSSLGGAAGGCCLQIQHNESVVVHHNTWQMDTS